MDNKKLSIRPVLNLDSKSVDENFQNRTLRPILKLQHSIILQVFTHFAHQQKTHIALLTSEKLELYVRSVTRKNTVLRNQLLGLIIGQFTEDEFETFALNDAEFK